MKLAYVGLVIIGLSATLSVPVSAKSNGILMEFDKSIPEITVHSIINIVSPYGQFPVGTPIQNAALSSGGNILVSGIDSNGHLIVAKILSVNDKDTKFTSKSTALAIIYITFGAPFMTPNITEAIEKAPDFIKLVEAIDAAFAAGKPPIGFPGVGENLALVESEAASNANP